MKLTETRPDQYGVISRIRERKHGTCSCGCGCAGCSGCASRKKEDEKL